MSATLAPLPEVLRAWALSRGSGGRGGGEKGGTAPSGREPSGLTGGAGTSTLAARGLRALERPRLLAALAVIRADQSYDHWFRTGAAIHSWDPSPTGLALFRAWSARAENYRTEEAQLACGKKWAEYEKPKPGKRLVTIASIYEEALALQNEKISGNAGTIVGSAEPAAEEEKKTNGHQALGILPSQFAQGITWPDRNKGNRPTATCRNTRVAITALGLVCEHDVFHNQMRIGGAPIAEWAGELTDNAVHMLRVAIERAYHFDPGTPACHDAAVQECLQHGFDPVLDYLDGLAWDGVPRLEHWMTRYLGAEDSAYVRAVACLSLLAAVRRARVPGTKFDQIIVLEGPEGRGKSSAIEILAGTENFSDQTILTLDDKAQQEAMEGVWLFEIADLAGHSKAEVERVKAFCSRTYDRARPAYGRSRVDRPRRCIFFATTNNDTYLKSQTGNRRFWPVRCGTFDLEGLARDRDQLWAEAAQREPAARLMLPTGLWGAAAEMQDSRREHDPWDDLMADIAGGPYAKTLFQTSDSKATEYRILTADIMELVLKLSIDRVTDVTGKRIAFSMRRLGWDGPKLIRIDKNVGRGYTKLAGSWP